MKVLISRAYGKNETRGSLFVLEGSDLLYRCKTIELPDNGNQRNASCIQEGEYQVVKYTRENGDVVFLLLDVPGREAIEIHIGNYVSGGKIDTRGCILPGNYFSDLNEDGFIDIADSTMAMNTLLKILPDKFTLYII